MIDLTSFTDEQVFALYRVAKTRAYAFFRDPREMIWLRNEKDARITRLSPTEDPT